VNLDLRQRLLYRRQYFFGPDIEVREGWSSLKMPGGNALSVHPDLKLTQVEQPGCRLVLIGYLLDPNDPKANDEQILNRLAVSAGLDQLVAALDDLGGRYVLFISLENDYWVLSDAGGLRQVYYHQDQQGRFWLGAQPGQFRDVFGFEYPDEVTGFLNSDTIRKYREPWFPGDSTPFGEVKHLLPNHMLNLLTGEVRRYWPHEPVRRYSMEEGARTAATILQKLMRAANNRFKLAMGLTGGYDSRIVFAASKEIVQDLHVYSMIYHRLSEQSPDITLAGELTKFAGVPHQVFRCDQPMNEDFEYLYTHNLDKVFQSYGNIVFGRYQNLDQKLVVVKSVVNEIARCFYYRNGVYPYRVTTEFLCKVSKLGDHPFVFKHFDVWLQEAMQVEQFGYKVLDFFYWENRNANWQAMSQLEFDLAQEEFTPFAHHRLLATMLGVNHRYRCMPKNLLQREMVRASWPELDVYPYNPRGKVIKKPFYEGPWMSVGRWIKYNLLTKRN
jgi:hypothetical protein